MDDTTKESTWFSKKEDLFDTLVLGFVDKVGESVGTNVIWISKEGLMGH